MKITRQYTEPGISPYTGAAAGLFVCTPERDGSRLTNALLHDGIAAQLRPVVEQDVPDWLWRHEPDESALARLPDSARYRGESTMIEAIDRLAGGWAYDGWKGGYFDTEQDARAFFDECRWLLFHRKCCPAIAQWAVSGLYWAYGLAAGADGCVVVDYRSGAIRRAGAGDRPPRGMVINGLADSPSGEGGAWDLWRREAPVLAGGGQCGANVSNARSRSGIRSLSAFLDAGDAAAECAYGGSPGVPSVRRIRVDANHPASREAARRHATSRATGEIYATGGAIAHRHIAAVLDACAGDRDRKAGDPAHNTTLRLALRSARQAGVPETAIRRALALTDRNPQPTSDQVLPSHDAFATADGRTVTVIGMGDGVLHEALARGDCPAADLLDSVATSAWTAGHTGLDFDSTAQHWNTCGASGAVRGAAGDGSFAFLDDTAAEYAVLDAAAFRHGDTAFDTDGFRHAAELLAVALDISLMSAAQATPRVARRVWDFRPVALSLAGVAEVLMAHGVAYDSDAGRAWCAGLCALLTGAAYRRSALIADEMGACPAQERNAATMRDVLAAHRSALREHVMPTALAGAVRDVWDDAVRAARDGGLRNAFVSAVCTAPAETAYLERTAQGIAPVASLVRWEATATGGYRKTIDPAVPQGLRALGYTAEQTDAVVRHVIGHATLARAPGVNHETLRRRGFTDAAIATVEAALADIDDISLVFNRWVLGDAFCRDMLCFTADDLRQDDFDMLAALGFSDAGIEAANIHCCGADSVEGAPFLSPDHLAVFDCAVPQGARGRRGLAPESVVAMMAAAQPVVSGGIGHVLDMPETATIEECRAIFLLAWRLGLKSLVVHRREAEPAGFAEPAGDAAGRSVPALAAAAESSPRLAPSTDGRAVPDISGPEPAETAIAEDDLVARDAETSRCASSLAARSTASVPSSADAVVEQRQV